MKMDGVSQMYGLLMVLSLIQKDVLKQMGSKVWLKWPNDFYVNDKNNLMVFN